MAAITSSAVNQGMSSIILSYECEIFGIDDLWAVRRYILQLGHGFEMREYQRQCVNIRAECRGICYRSHCISEKKRKNAKAVDERERITT